MIYLPCPYCTNDIKYSRQHAGEIVQCGWCYKDLRLPYFSELSKEAAEELVWQENRQQKKQEKKVLKETKKQDKIQQDVERLKKMNERWAKQQASDRQNTLLERQLQNSPIEIEKQKLIAQQKTASNLFAIRIMLAITIFIVFVLPSCLKLL